MFRSVFIRLIVTYFIIIVITIVTLSLLLSQIFRTSYYETKKRDLFDEAKNINIITEKNILGLISDDIYNYELAFIARQLNASIWVIDRFGYFIQVADPTQKKQLEGQQFSQDEITQYLQQVLNGKEIASTGSFDRRFPVPVLTIGTPLIINKQIVGAIFINTHLNEVNKVYATLYEKIWISAAISGLIAILLIFWISRRISDPLIQINTIVKDITKGNFKKEIRITSHDEIGELATSFNIMANELKNLEELRKGFVANVSHELRSPLTSIQGFIYGMIDGTINERDHLPYLKIVLNETMRLNNLITDLLDLSQIESGRIPLRIISYDINEQIRCILIKHESQITEKQLDIEVIFGDDRVMVDADKDRIEQVLDNILDNAIKFSDKRGKLSVMTHAHAEKVNVSIRDSGLGISDDELPFIWERFYKSDKAHSPEYQGTGLGLSIIKKIIEQHDQKIFVKSQIGKGSIFTFSLKKTS